MQPERQMPSPSPRGSKDAISARSSTVVRGVVNLVIGTIALGAGERLAVGDTRGASIAAAVDGAIIVADAIATGLITRRANRIAAQQQVTIEAQTAEIATLRRENNSQTS